jgi:hypothetical protein
MRQNRCVNAVPEAPCTEAYTNYLTRAWRIAARSRHEGGVHALVMDGSVRFVGENIDNTIWRALATLDGSETIGEF